MLSPIGNLQDHHKRARFVRIITESELLSDEELLASLINSLSQGRIKRHGGVVATDKESKHRQKILSSHAVDGVMERGSYRFKGEKRKKAPTIVHHNFLEYGYSN